MIFLKKKPRKKTEIIYQMQSPILSGGKKFYPIVMGLKCGDEITFSSEHATDFAESLDEAIMMCKKFTNDANKETV